MSEVESVTADEWRDRGNPAAIGAIVLLPKVSAINWRRGVQSFRELRRKPCVAGFFLEAGEIFARFKIAQLIFDKNHFQAYGEIFVCVGF